MKPLAVPPVEPSAGGSRSVHNSSPAEVGVYPPVYIPVYSTSLPNRGRGPLSHLHEGALRPEMAGLPALPAHLPWHLRSPLGWRSIRHIGWAMRNRRKGVSRVPERSMLRVCVRECTCGAGCCAAAAGNLLLGPGWDGPRGSLPTWPPPSCSAGGGRDGPPRTIAASMSEGWWHWTHWRWTRVAW